MLLYNNGDPIKAMKLLGPWIKQIHLKDANVTQSDDNVTAKSQQIDVKGNVAKVGAWKRKLQIAINGAYPYNDPASAPHRTLFGLPPDKPYNPGIGASV